MYPLASRLKSLGKWHQVLLLKPPLSLGKFPIDPFQTAVPKCVNFSLGAHSFSSSLLSSFTTACQILSVGADHDASKATGETGKTSEELGFSC